MDHGLRTTDEIGAAPWRDIPALVFVHLFPVTMSWLYLIVFRSPAEVPAPGGPAAIAFGTAKVVQFCFPLLYVLCFERARLRLAAPSARGLEFGLGFGVTVGLLICAVYFGGVGQSRLFAQSPAKVFHLLQELHATTPLRYLILAAIFSLGHSFLEEYYWRWFAFGWLRRYTPLGFAIALSALGFSAHHLLLLDVYFPGRFWTLVVPQALAVAVGGAVWAWIYQRSGSLYAPWISHVLIDAGLFVVGYAMVAPYWARPI